MTNSVPLERLLILAGPGKGKTYILKRIVQHFRAGGVLVDPLNEFGDVVGERWNHFTKLRYQSTGPDEPNPDLEDLFRILDELTPGTAVIFNEGHRWIPNVPGGGPVLQYLDTARNRGVLFAIESKRPVMLPPLVTDLVQAVAYKPFRSPSSKQWVRAAGADPDLPQLPLEDWYLMRESGDDIFSVDADALAKNFGREFHLTGSPVAGDI